MGYNPQNPNGQAAMAASAPVAIASDQSALTADSPLAIELLASLLDRLGPIGLAIDPASGRLRVLIDTLGGAQTIGTVSTVTTVNTVSAVTNLPTIGGLSANYDQISAMQQMVNGLRDRITVA